MNFEISRLQHGGKLGYAQSLGHRRNPCCPSNSESDLRTETDLPDHPHHLLLSSRFQLNPTHPRIIHTKETVAFAMANSGLKVPELIRIICYCDKQ